MAMKRQQSSCPIPYPDRFYAAQKYADSLSEAAFNDETRLLLYALHQQAVVGTCKEPKPWSWNVVESAKWQSWNQLGRMSAMEAMRLYVRTLDEEQPEWWTRQLPNGHIGNGGDIAAANAAHGAPAAAAPPTTSPTPAASVSISSVMAPGSWVVISQGSARRPVPRYEHGAALLGGRLFVLGGHYGGRPLNDAWVYDLDRLQWAPTSLEAGKQAQQADADAPGTASLEAQQAASQAALDAPSTAGSGSEAAPPPPADLAPSVGLTVTAWKGRLLLVGGHIKGPQASGQPIRVSVLDPATMVLSQVETYGEVPCARGGHSACLSDSTLYLYGGEDSSRRPLADLYTLNLDTLTWSSVAYEGRPRDQPPARSAAVVAIYQSRYLLLFGGGTIGACLGDTWVLDLDSRTWSSPQLHGDTPAPRAGHAAALAGDTWYILGGGNHVEGCTDMMAADLEELPGGSLTWRRVCSVPVGSPLASEGLSINYTPELGLLVAFGGYNGKYHNAVSVYKPPAPGSEGLAAAGGQLTQASSAALDDVADVAALARAGSAPAANGDGAPLSHEQALLRELAIQREQLKQELAGVQGQVQALVAEAVALRDAGQQQAQQLQQQLAQAQAAAAEAAKVQEEAQVALSAEQARTQQLGLQVADVEAHLAAAKELEQELAGYKAAEAEAAKKSAAGRGVWGYISGA